MRMDQVEIHLSDLVENYQGDLSYALGMLGGQAEWNYHKGMSPDDVVQLILEDLWNLGAVYQLEEDLDDPEIRERGLLELLERYSPNPHTLD